LKQQIDEGGFRFDENEKADKPDSIEMKEGGVKIGKELKSFMLAFLSVQ
jgi:hypothetical protein